MWETEKRLNISIRIHTIYVMNRIVGAFRVLIDLNQKMKTNVAGYGLKLKVCINQL